MLHTYYDAPCCSFDSLSNRPPNVSSAGGHRYLVARSYLLDPLVHGKWSESCSCESQPIRIRTLEVDYFHQHWTHSIIVLGEGKEQQEAP